MTTRKGVLQGDLNNDIVPHYLFVFVTKLLLIIHKGLDEAAEDTANWLRNLCISETTIPWTGSLINLMSWHIILLS